MRSRASLNMGHVLIGDRLSRALSPYGGSRGSSGRDPNGTIGGSHINPGMNSPNQIEHERKFIRLH